MSESNEQNDGTRRAKEEMEFLHLTSEFRDVGVESFERRMQYMCDELTRKYAHRDDVVEEEAAGELQEINDRLSEEWPYYGAAVTITGRVYPYDDDYRSSFPEEWQESYDNDGGNRGDLYFMLKDESLYSRGPHIEVAWNDDLGTVDKFFCVHLFATTPDVDDYYGDDFLLYAFPADIFSQQYETPTIEEVEWRLEYKWPEANKLIHRYIHPNLQRQLPARLDLIVKKIQSELRGDSDLVEYAQRSINLHADLDQTTPYALTIKNTFELWGLDGDYDPDDPAGWTRHAVQDNDGIPILLHEPEVALMTLKDDTVVPVLIGAVYSQEDEDPEFVCVEAANIDAFLSTRMVTSLGSRALWSDTQADVAVAHSAEAAEYVSLPFESEMAPRTSSYDEIIASLKAAETILQGVIAEGSALGDRVYPTKEGAFIAAQEVVETIASRLLTPEAVSLLELLPVNVSGDVTVPRARVNAQRDKASASYIVSLHSDDIKKLDAGDSLKGMFSGIDIQIDNLADDKSNDASGYVPRIILLARTIDDSSNKGATTYSMTRNGVLLANVTKETYMSVPLDGSAQVTIETLDRYRLVRNNLKEMHNAYHEKYPDVDNDVNRLYRAFIVSLLTSDVVNLKKAPDFLCRISNDIQHLREEGVRTAPAIETIDAIFVNKYVKITGNILDKNNEEYECQGNVIDVRTDMLNDDIVFAVASFDDGEIYYYPFKQISKLLC